MLYIPARNHGGTSNHPIIRIVMHGTVSPCVVGGARVVGAMFHTTTRDASTQYVVDPAEAVQCVPDNVVAYGAPPNTGEIHVEQCDPQTGPPARWNDAAHQAELRMAAKLVATLCTKYAIPVRHLTVAELRAGEKGICGHVDVTNAWHQTTHVDPGVGYPWGQFLALVKQYQIGGPTPGPVPAPSGDDLMIAYDYYETTPIALTPGLWVDLTWQRPDKVVQKSLIACTGGHVTVDAGFTLSTPVAGVARFVEIDKTGTIVAYRGKEEPFVADRVEHDLHRTFDTTAGRLLRMQVKVDAPAVVGSRNETTLVFDK